MAHLRGFGSLLKMTICYVSGWHRYAILSGESIKGQQSVAAPLASDSCKSDDLQLSISYFLPFHVAKRCQRNSPDNGPRYLMTVPAPPAVSAYPMVVPPAPLSWRWNPDPSPRCCRTCSCLSIPGASLLVIIENLDISLYTACSCMLILQLKSQLHSKRKLANLNVIVAPFFMQSCKTDMASAMQMSVDKINGHGHLCSV